MTTPSSLSTRPTKRQRTLDIVASELRATAEHHSLMEPGELEFVCKRLADEVQQTSKTLQSRIQELEAMLAISSSNSDISTSDKISTHTTTTTSAAITPTRTSVTKNINITNSLATVGVGSDSVTRITTTTTTASFDNSLPPTPSQKRLRKGDRVKLRFERGWHAGIISRINPKRYTVNRYKVITCKNSTATTARILYYDCQPNFLSRPSASDLETKSHLWEYCEMRLRNKKNKTSRIEQQLQDVLATQPQKLVGDAVINGD